MYRQPKAISADLVPPSSTQAGVRRLLLSIFRWPVLPPSLIALFSQLSAAACLLILLPASGFLGLTIPPVPASFLHGVIAAFIGLRWGLAPWWLLINLLFVPAVVLTLSFDIAPLWFLAAFILFLLAYWSVFRSQVPLYHSSRKAWAAVADLLPCKPDFCLLDVGAGLGGMLGYLSRKRPDGKFYGMEIAPLPFVFAWLRTKVERGACQIRWGDFWAHSFAAYDVIYAYLSPVPMNRIWAKACMEMAPDTCFISNSFPIPEAKPEKIVDLDDFHHSRLYIYRIPARQPVGEAL